MSLIAFICWKGEGSIKEAILIFGDERPMEISSLGGIIVRSCEVEVDEVKFRSVSWWGIERITWFGATVAADGEGLRQETEQIGWVGICPLTRQRFGSVTWIWLSWNQSWSHSHPTKELGGLHLVDLRAPNNWLHQVGAEPTLVRVQCPIGFGWDTIELEETWVAIEWGRRSDPKQEVALEWLLVPPRVGW